MQLSQRDRVHVVTPSRWLAEQVSHSALGRFPHSLIPYGIDLDRFRPHDRKAARAKFGLADDQFCFLFFATNLHDPRKGWKRLERVLTEFGLPAGSTLLFAGKGAGDLAEKFRTMSVQDLGYLTGAERVAECLSAADCMLLLSEADNLPYTAIEASACGCPVLAVDIGGIREIVEHGVNGWLIPRTSGPAVLAAAMRQAAAQDLAGRTRLSTQARERALEKFPIQQFIHSYEDLFTEMIQTHGPRKYFLFGRKQPDKQEFEREIAAYAADPENRESFARLLTEILPNYTYWTWGKDDTYRSHFNAWQRSGFNLSPNHYYSPIPDVASLTDHDLNKTFSMPGMDLREDVQLGFLSECGGFREEYGRFPLSKRSTDTEFHFKNGTFESGDAEVLHCMVRSYRPQRVIEVGSGFTTLVTAGACELNRKAYGVECQFTAIEPYPNDLFLKPIAGLSALMKTPLQQVDFSVFASLQENDILFIDSTHVLKLGSDVQQLYLDIIPRLNPGVIVHVHDIFLPKEYPKHWIMDEHIFWTEQYLLQAFLSFNDAFEVLWAGSFMHLRHPKELEEMFPAYDSGSCIPGSFWFRRRTH